MATCATGILFSLLSGQPLVIIGVTGPVLLFDELLYSVSRAMHTGNSRASFFWFQFCQENEVEFLPIRVWIGIWIAILATLVVAFEGSTLVRFFTRFTQEIFASLISLLYLFESMNKLYVVSLIEGYSWLQLMWITCADICPAPSATSECLLQQHTGE